MAVLRETLKQVEAMSKEMSWAPRKGESFEKLLPALTVAACDEFISPKLCGQCHGRGERTKRGEGLIVVCGHCEGTGKRDKSISDRARQMGVQRHAFADSWADRYEKVLEVLAIAEGSGSGELSKQLSDQ